MKTVRNKLKDDNTHSIDIMIPPPGRWVEWGTIIIIIVMACISVGCFNLPCSKTIKGNVVSCKKECIKMGNIDKTDNYINKCICLIQVLSSEYSRIKVGQKVEVKIKVNKNHEITAVGNIISLNNNNMVLASFMLEHERALYEDMLDKKTIRATAHIFIEHFLLGESIFNSFRNLFK